MDDLEVRELRYFVAVAEDLNFSRAADRLGMAQPPLSRAIRTLERRLGVQLFERSTRQVQLTAAGQTMLEHAVVALAGMAAVARRTRRAAEPTQHLVVTAKPGDMTSLLKRIVDVYAAQPDTPPVEILVGGYRHQADMVRDGRADLALLSSPYDRRGLDAEPLTSQPRVAALPAGHDLAGRAALRCQDFERLPVPQWPESNAAERRYWSGRDRGTSNAGAITPEPVPGPVVSDGAQLLEVVGLGQAVALIPWSLAAANRRPDIAYRPVSDASPYITEIGWPEGARSQPMAQFVRTAIELTAEAREQGFPEVS